MLFFSSFSYHPRYLERLKSGSIRPLVGLTGLAPTMYPFLPIETAMYFVSP